MICLIFGMGRILGDGCLNCDLFDFGMGRILGDGCLNCDLFDFGMGRILGDGCLNCDLFDFGMGRILGDGCLNCDLFDFGMGRILGDGRTAVRPHGLVGEPWGQKGISWMVRGMRPRWAALGRRARSRLLDWGRTRRSTQSPR